MQQLPKRTIGLLGVSANPLHQGHVEAAKAASYDLNLREVWFMVTPHSPHKDPALYVPLEHRTHLAHLALMETARLGDRLKVSDFEANLLRFGEENSTANMLKHFEAVYETLQPVWMMGADNLATLHTWGRWHEIMTDYPVVVLARDQQTTDALRSPAALAFKHAQVEPAQFAATPGTWTFYRGVDSHYSSTLIRQELQSGLSPAGLTTAQIQHIREYGLYGTRTQ